jgi:hypothetical protein
MDSFKEAGRRFGYRQINKITARLEEAGICSGGLFDCDCLGASTRVLTNNGWKRIVDVVHSDMLWDGDEWVKHDGLIFRGVSETMGFRGIAITDDHLVLSGGDWIEAKSADPELVFVSGERATPEAAHQTGMQAVFDLLNAGPRNRFTVCGSDGIPFVVHNCACAAPPDYSGVANASKESSEIMAALGREQLAETRRQYDRNTAISDPIVKAQAGLMGQTIEQGDDYYKFMKEYGRPTDIALQQEAMASGGTAAQEAAAGRVRGGLEQAQASEMAQENRAMAGMGVNPNSGRFAGLSSSRSVANAAMTAGAMDKARMDEKNLGFAKKLDVSGVFRGLPGASQGAYSVANQSGNSAVGNTMAPGQAMVNGMGQGAQTIASGQAMRINGLSSVMNAQQGLNIANANMMRGDGGAGMIQGLGTLAMGAAAFSDDNLKENIVRVGEHEKYGFGIYEFNYKGDDVRWRGVMASEIEEFIPDAVAVDADGYRHVDYSKIGVEMQRVE